jgi:hypothetical protein
VADLISTKLEGSSYQVSLSTLIGKGKVIFDSDLLGGDADGRVLEAFKHAGLVID